MFDVRAYLDAIRGDLRYAARALRKSPGFTAAAVLTLALGIAASTAIFSMVNGVLLHSLPIGSGDRFVHLKQSSSRSDNDGFSVIEVHDLGRDSRAMSGVAEYHSMSFQLYGYGEPLRVQTGVVSDKFFDMLGVKAAIGRTFLPGEEAVGAPPVVVLTHQFWMDQFHGDSAIIGAKFTMNDKVHTVVGVLPPMASYPGRDEIFMPAGACPFRSAPSMMNDRAMHMLDAYAVLRPGVSLERARSELGALGDRYHTEFPAAYPVTQRFHFVVESAREEMTARAKPIFLLLLGTAAFLLLAAVANVINLSLSRQVRRSRELAVRVALGAGTTRLYRQLALESLLLAIGGGIGGVMVAASGVGLLRATAARLTPRANEIQMNGAVFAFALATCVVIALVIAAVPFVLSPRRSLADSLRQGSTGSMAAGGEHRTRRVLVAAQVAISVVMLVGAGLIGRSLVELERVDAGVDVSHVLTARLTLNFTKYRDAQQSRNFADAVLERVTALPGVSAAALASTLPLATGSPSDVNFAIERAPTAPGSRGPHADFTAVSPDYFRAVGVPLLRGRPFTGADRDTLAPPVILSRRLANTYWSERDPIGTRISPDSGKHWFTVVGIVGDVRVRGIDQDVTDEVYVPVASQSVGDLRVFLRTNGPMSPVVTALRAAVHGIDPQQPVSAVQSLAEVRGAQLAEPRLTTALLGAFAIVALTLTAIGLAGVIAHGITQRLPEIALRVALGATSARVLSLVTRQGLAMVVIGLAIGFGIAFEASRLVTKLLFHVSATDATTYVAVGGVILATATLACLLPSRRALRTDPAQALRGG